MKRIILIAMALVMGLSLVACGEKAPTPAPTPTPSQSAPAPTPETPDATPETPDTTPETPDATPETPDATVPPAGEGSPSEDLVNVDDEAGKPGSNLTGEVSLAGSAVDQSGRRGESNLSNTTKVITMIPSNGGAVSRGRAMQTR